MFVIHWEGRTRQQGWPGIERGQAKKKKKSFIDDWLMSSSWQAWRPSCQASYWKGKVESCFLLYSGFLARTFLVLHVNRVIRWFVQCT
jgi:hypothetical protein